MFLSVMLLACGLGIEAPAEASPRLSPLVKYQIRVLDVPGLNWRGEGYGTIQAVARQGATSIWTAPTSYLQVLKDQAYRTVCAPNVCCEPSASATVRFQQIRAIVGGLKRHADGPMGRASAVAFEPEIDKITERFQATISGRAMDQGVLTEIAIDDQRLAAIQHYNVTETLVRKTDSTTQEKPQRVVGQAQVPHIIESHAKGEWMIPDGQMLIISLGASFEPDDKDPTRVVERLVLIGVGSVARLDPADCAPSGDVAARASKPPLPLKKPVTPDVAAGSKWQAVSGPLPLVHQPGPLTHHPAGSAPRDTAALRASLARMVVVPTPLITPGHASPPRGAATLAAGQPARPHTPHVPIRQLPVGVGAKGELALPPLPVDADVAAASATASDDPSAEARASSQTPHLDGGSARILHAVAKASAEAGSARPDNAVHKASTRSAPAPQSPGACPHGCTSNVPDQTQGMTLSWGKVRLEIQIKRTSSSNR